MKVIKLIFSIVSVITVIGLSRSAHSTTSLLGYYNTNIQAWDVALSSNGNNAYVVGWGGYDSFQSFDVTNPHLPTLLGGLTTGSSSRILLSNDETKAYVVNDYGGFKIVDITNPANPNILGTYNNGNPITRNVAISNDGTKAFVTDGIVGLQILDITNPTSPSLIGIYKSNDPCLIWGQPAYEGNCEAYGIDVYGSTAYVAWGWGGLKIIDVTNPTSPNLIGRLHVNTNMGSINNVHISADGTKAFLTGLGGSKDGINLASFNIVDVTNPTSPKILGQLGDPRGLFRSIALSSNEKTAFLGGSNVGLQIIDISSLTSPRLVDEFYEVINSWAPQVSGIVLSKDDSIAYIAEGVSGLRIVDVSKGSCQ